MTDNPQPIPRHTLIDDAQGLIFGTAMCAISVVLLQQLGLVTGQTAGLAIVLTHLTGVGFGILFFLLNLPFYWLAFRRMGLRFTARTVVAVVLVSGMTTALPAMIGKLELHPLLGATYAGMFAGAGLLAIFRHGGSLGGVGILGLYLQEKTGFRAGWTQLLFDVIVFGLAATILDLNAVFYSLAGAVVLNLVIALNHRRDRYIAM